MSKVLRQEHCGELSPRFWEIRVAPQRGCTGTHAAWGANRRTRDLQARAGLPSRWDQSCGGTAHSAGALHGWIRDLQVGLARMVRMGSSM